MEADPWEDESFEAAEEFIHEAQPIEEVEFLHEDDYQRIQSAFIKEEDDDEDEEDDDDEAEDDHEEDDDDEHSQ